MALNPNLAEAHMALAHLLVNIGRAEEADAACAQGDRAGSAVAAGQLAGGKLPRHGGTQGRGAASTSTRRWNWSRTPGWRCASAAAAGWRAATTPRAIAELQRAAEISHDSSQILNSLGQAYVKAGDRAAAERVLAELEQRRRDGYVPATSLAMVVHALGDTGRALDLLEQGYRERDVRMSFLLMDWPQLRSEPRYQALLQRMHLPSPPGGERPALGNTAARPGPGPATP